jgi:hypothetical protein
MFDAPFEWPIISPSRGFLPGRFAYAGPGVRGATVMGPDHAAVICFVNDAAGSANLHYSGRAPNDGHVPELVQGHDPFPWEAYWPFRPLSGLI